MPTRAGRPRMGRPVCRGYDRAMFAGDNERERAAALLREHYVRGRLTVDERSSRTERVLAARSRADLRAALIGLPMLPDLRELTEQGRLLGRTALRGAALVVFTGAYIVFSFTLLLVLGLMLLIHGASDTALAG